MGLANLLQRLSQEGQVGVLKIRSGDRLRTIRLKKRGLSVSSENDPKVRPLGETLVTRGLLTRCELTEAERIRARLGIPLESAVVRLRFVPRAVLSMVLAEQVREDLCDVLAWEDGTFEFAGDAEDPAGSPGADTKTLRVDVQGFLLDAARVMDEFHRPRSTTMGSATSSARPPTSARPGGS